MKETWKPYIRWGVTAFLLYLAVICWPKLVTGVGMAVHAAGPLVLGGVIAYVANILMSFYERKIRLKHAWWKKIRRPVCLLLALATVVLVIFLLLRLILFPAAAVAAAVALDFRGIALASILMVFGCPLGTVTYTIAQQMDSDAELAGEQVIFSTLFSCLTLFVSIFILSRLGLI